MMVDQGSAYPLRLKFWELPLADLTDQEWDALCDGCGQCCLHKFQDEETGKTVVSSIACRYLDHFCGRCTVYSARKIKKPECFVLDRTDIEQFELHLSWLPETCAYRLISKGKPLYDWHPLRALEQSVTQGSADSCSVSVNTTERMLEARFDPALRQPMIEAGVAVDGRVTSEAYVHESEWDRFVLNGDLCHS